MIDLRLQTLGADWKPVTWRQLEKGLERDLARLLQAWTQRLAREAKKAAPLDMGGLRSSITAQVHQRLNELVGVVGTNLRIAPFVEFGTGVHSVYPGAPRRRIVPVRAKALRIPVGRFKNLGAALEAQPDLHGVDYRGKFAVTAFIWRSSIAGMKPQPFLTALLEKHRTAIVGDLLQLAQKHGFR